MSSGVLHSSTECNDNELIIALCVYSRLGFLVWDRVDSYVSLHLMQSSSVPHTFRVGVMLTMRVIVISCSQANRSSISSRALPRLF